jgi:hypothetical protein
MARFTVKCSVSDAIGESGGISSPRRSGTELGLHSMIERMRNEGVESFYTGKVTLCVSRRDQGLSVRNNNNIINLNKSPCGK